MWPEETEKENKIKFVYEKSPHYQLFTVTHVWGGLDRYGNLCFDLIEERRSVPPGLTVSLKDDSATEIWDETEVNFIRTRHAGVTIPIEVVPSIIEWLEDKIKIHDDQK